MGELTFELKDLHFFSFHGLYEEERKVGGEFNVDLFVKYKSTNKTITNIKDTINYVSLYEIVKIEMQKPQALLETVASYVVDKIHQKYSLVNEVEIVITKKHPPIIGFIGKVSVRLNKVF